MKKFFSKLFEDFYRIFCIISPSNKVKTLILFIMMAVQSGLELLFILTLAYMGTALTTPDSLNTNPLFKTLYYCFPALEEWSKNPRYLVLISGFIVVSVSILKNAMSWITAKYTALHGEMISIDIGSEIMSYFLYSDYMWHLSSESSTTFQRMQWRGNLSMMLINQLYMYACIFTMLVLFISLVGQEPILTTLTITITGIVAFILYRTIRRKVDTAATITARSTQEENRAIMCATRGIRDVLVYRQQEIFLRSVVDSAKAGIEARVFNTLAPTMPTWVLESTGFMVVVLSLAYLVFVDHAGIARITTALGLLLLTAWRVLPYSNRVVSYQVSIRALRPTVLAVLDLLESLRNREKSALIEPDPNFTLQREVALRRVSFRYPGASEDCLHEMSFRIRVGEKIGIIGPSGAGKSTLVGILSGLLLPSHGVIEADEEPLTPARTAALRSLVGYVPQSPFLFAGTLAENVAFCQWGRPWDEDRVRAACKKAAIDFIETHPLGLNQPIGENGSGLSGGQAQRVSIARALYAEPKLLIFDEATSALDQANEDSIQRTITHLVGETTCIIVAHRLTTIEKCDTIIWMEKGQIFMQGRPDEILPLYRNTQQTISAQPCITQ